MDPNWNPLQDISSRPSTCLELQVSPELYTRLTALPGLENATHAERLTALCDLWELLHVHSLPAR